MFSCTFEYKRKYGWENKTTWKKIRKQDSSKTLKEIPFTHIFSYRLCNSRERGKEKSSLKWGAKIYDPLLPPLRHVNRVIDCKFAREKKLKIYVKKVQKSWHWSHPTTELLITFTPVLHHSVKRCGENFRCYKCDAMGTNMTLNYRWRHKTAHYHIRPNFWRSENNLFKTNVPWRLVEDI